MVLFAGLVLLAAGGWGIWRSVRLPDGWAYNEWASLWSSVFVGVMFALGIVLTIIGIVS